MDSSNSLMVALPGNANGRVDMWRYAFQRPFNGVPKRRRPLSIKRGLVSLACGVGACHVSGSRSIGMDASAMPPPPHPPGRHLPRAGHALDT